MNETLCEPQALIASMRAGDLVALDTMSRCYGQRLLAVGRRHCRDEEAARDAVQDALLSAGEHLTDFRGEGSVEGWLVRMVTNACYRMRRGRKNNPQLHRPYDQVMEGVAAPADPERLAVKGRLMEQLAEALLELEPIDRTLILLTDGEGYKAPELAERTGMTPAAVRTRISRARRRLRDRLPEITATL